MKDYLLKGYAINQRMERIESKLIEHDQKFDLLIKTNLPPLEGVFYDGQIFDAHQFVSGLIKSAKISVILIDNYIDESVLFLLSKRKSGVKSVIYTNDIPRQLKLDIDRFNAQYPEIEVGKFSKSHDRFLILDEKDVYHIGASLKDLGNKWFAFSKIEPLRGFSPVLYKEQCWKSGFFPIFKSSNFQIVKFYTERSRSA